MPTKRLVSIFTDGELDMSCGEYDSEYFGLARLTVVQRPIEQAIMVGLDGDVAALGSGVNDAEDSIPMGKADTPLFSSAHAIANIDGYAYVVGPWRTICRRTAPDVWENLAHRTSLPRPEPDKFGSTDDGFDCIAGYNATDIYAGGGEGDLWHFDGKRWDQCPVPTNMKIENICCAGDGHVYVGLQSGSIMRGRENKWKMIHNGTFSLPFKDMAWFDGKVYCTSDYGVWTIENGKFINPDLPAEVRSCSGNLSVGDGVMLLAGMYGATVYDGSKWTSLLPTSM